MSKKNGREIFDKEKIAKIILGKKRENFSDSIVPESDRNCDFRVPKKAFYELCTKLHPYLQKKKNRLRRPMSVEVQVVYYISVKYAVGKLQMLLVFLEHQIRL